MFINNLPDYALAYKYIVYREVNCESWFYGAFNDAAKAAVSAAEIGGKFIMTEAVKNDAI